MEFRLPAVSAAAVGICLAVSIAAGHPGAGLVAGGGALTIGFGVNQRITDSRILPMVLAALATALATLAGLGHRSYTLLVGSAIAAAIYGILTVRNSGLAWVGQQASIALFVSSAFPSGPRPAFERAGLIAAGSLVQLLMTAAALRLIPELRKDLLAIPITVYTSLYEQREEFLRRLRNLPKALPAPQRPAAILYATRLLVTVVAATEVYRRLGIQSGYWIPMTALLVQKPAFYETATPAWRVSPAPSPAPASPRCSSATSPRATGFRATGRSPRSPPSSPTGPSRRSRSTTRSTASSSRPTSSSCFRSMSSPAPRSHIAAPSAPPPAPPSRCCSMWTSCGAVCGIRQQ